MSKALSSSIFFVASMGPRGETVPLHEPPAAELLLPTTAWGTNYVAAGPTVPTTWAASCGVMAVRVLVS